MHQLRPIVFSGPSGSGKSTLLKLLMERNKDCFAFTVSHTTRKPRPGELDGKDYHFVSREDMVRAIQDNKFIEYAEFSGNLYGTSKMAVERVQSSGKLCVLDIDMQGVKNVKAIPSLNARFISIQPPNFEILEKRLRGRGTETEDKVQARLCRAKDEMEFSRIEGMFDLRVVNDDVDVAVSQIEGYLTDDLRIVKDNLFSAFNK